MKNAISLCCSLKIIFLSSWETHDYTKNMINTSSERIYFTKAKVLISRLYHRMQFRQKEDNHVLPVADSC